MEELKTLMVSRKEFINSMFPAAAVATAAAGFNRATKVRNLLV